MILTHHGINSLGNSEPGPQYGSVVIGDKTYRTIIIGNQEWIVENLDWAWAGLDVGSGGTSSDTPKANYYDNDETTYGWDGRKCGLLYNWPAVQYLDENSDVMLPDGWRVATRDDWDALAEAVGGATDAGTKLKSANVPWTIQTDSWGGTDDYHFEALPAGYIDTSFVGSGICTYFWTSNDEPNFNEIAYCSYMSEGASLGSYSNYKYYQLSVRLVRDYPPPVTIGGRSYKTVRIGNQEWMAENLDWKFSGLNFRDSVNNPLDTTTAIQAAYYNYDENTYGADGNKYGLLYNWYAVDYLNQHLAELGVPDGWHIPTNDEWSILASTCGNSDGTKLKSTTGWDNDGNGTDDYGFNAKPSGQWTNGFSTLGEIVVFYSTTLKYDYPIVRFIWYDDDRLDYDINPLYMAYSVRLVRNLS